MAAIRRTIRRTDLRPILVEGDIAYVTLTKGMVAIIDAVDVPIVQGWNWTAGGGKGGLFYAGRRETVAPGVGRWLLMHRTLVGCDDERIVEHRDRDTMNCRRYNLRIADQTINIQNASRRRDNQSGYRGVLYKPGKRRTKPWKAQINHRGKMYLLGGHPTAQAAARAYDLKAIELYGPDANLNF